MPKTPKSSMKTSNPRQSGPNPATEEQASGSGVRSRPRRRSQPMPRVSLAELYSSLPLDKRSKQIRVFDLQPLCNTTSPGSLTRIHGRLRVINVESNSSGNNNDDDEGSDNYPHFVALSYVWGTSSVPPRTVYCNGDCLVPVTDNLWDALDELRKDPRRADPGRNRDGSMTLWVDAICINQQDEDEKHFQIPLMGDIYTRAASTCIWLGAGTPESDAAVDGLHALVVQRESLVPKGEFLYRVPLRSYPWKLALGWGARAVLPLAIRLVREVIPRAKSPPALSPNGKGLDVSSEALAVLERAWIDRIWTLQEAVLSRRPWLCCGHRRISWRVILYAVAHLYWIDWYWHRLEHFGSRIRSWHNVLSLWLMVNEPLAPDPQRPDSLERILGKYLGYVKSMYVRRARSTVAFLLLLTILVLVAIVVPVAIIVEGGNDIARLLIVTLVGISLCLILIVGYLIIFPTGRGSLGKGWGTPLDAVAQEILSRKTTKPIDKAFGVHGILSRLGVDIGSQDNGQQQHLRKSQGDMYRELFVGLLSGIKNLNLLLLTSEVADFVDDDGRYPMWVPDFHRDDVNRWIDAAELLRDAHVPPWQNRKLTTGDMVFGVDAVPFDCTGSEKPKFELHPCGRELAVEGRKLGEITWRADEFVGPNEPVPGQQHQGDQNRGNDIILEEGLASSRAALVGNIHILLKALRKCRRSRLELSRSGRHLGTERHLGVYPLIDVAAVKALRLEYLLPRAANRYQRYPLTGTITRMMYNVHQPAERVASWWRHYKPGPLGMMCRVFDRFRACSRALCMTDVAGLGNCPSTARPGDIVILVAGVRLPVVLREIGSTRQGGSPLYRLVGYIIVEDTMIMNGWCWAYNSSPVTLGERRWFTLG